MQVLVTTSRRKKNKRVEKSWGCCFSGLRGGRQGGTRPICTEAIRPSCLPRLAAKRSAKTAGRSSSGVRGQGRGDPRPELAASAPWDSGVTRAERGGRGLREAAAGGARRLTARPGRLPEARGRAVAVRPREPRGVPRCRRRRPARPVSAAPQVAAGRAAGRRSLRLRPRGLRQPPRPAPGRAFSCPRPAGDGRGLSPLPAAAARGPRFEPQGLRSRVLGGSGPALAAAAAVAREELSLPCHRVPAEEGEGRDAAFPVPPAWLDLRGLRLPGNSKAAAGPGSARGLLVGAGPELLFGTPSRGKEAF